VVKIRCTGIRPDECIAMGSAGWSSVGDSAKRPRKRLQRAYVVDKALRQGLAFVEFRGDLDAFSSIVLSFADENASGTALTGAERRGGKGRGNGHEGQDGGDEGLHSDGWLVG